jgi:prevent-host-death family protein
METVNIHEAKTHLSKLLERARNGERIVIAKAGEPIAELGPLTRGRDIVFGSHEGELDIDWDALEAADEEMDQEIARMFYGEPRESDA